MLDWSDRIKDVREVEGGFLVTWAQEESNDRPPVVTLLRWIDPRLTRRGAEPPCANDGDSPVDDVGSD
ncbi:MAG: hypothetical protein IPM29_17135 [Planctomycetes bacterium]|nr:hypothetical protein [Planctomycetota bacterium]